jgi:hypothetical protein
MMSLRVLPWVLLILLAGCMEGQKPTPQQKKPLSERFGGEPAISAVNGEIGGSHVPARLGFSLAAARPGQLAAPGTSAAPIPRRSGR